jgi:hypothetical protein
LARRIEVGTENLKSAISHIRFVLTDSDDLAVVEDHNGIHEGGEWFLLTQQSRTLLMDPSRRFTQVMNELIMSHGRPDTDPLRTTLDTTYDDGSRLYFQDEP